MRFYSSTILLLLFALLVQIFAIPVDSEAEEPKPQPRRHHRRVHHVSHRKHRQMPQFPERNEKSAAYCGKHEHHVFCGPEKHCDKSCDNLYSPPHCFHDATNPKCYSPRCLCNEGYVRNAHGHCIRPTRCPNRYMEPSNDNAENDILIDFKPMNWRNHRIRKIRARKPPATLFL